MGDVPVQPNIDPQYTDDVKYNNTANQQIKIFSVKNIHCSDQKHQMI